MAIGRISGSVLKSNLTRNGVDLAFETNLLYLDVTNSRVGIGTSEPTTALQVAGTVTATTVNAGTVTTNVISSDDSSAVQVSDNLIPSADNTYSLGTPDRLWSALHVSGGTIYIGDIALSTEGTGNDARLKTKVKKAGKGPSDINIDTDYDDQNIVVSDFASGVVDTDLSSVSASDDTLASAKAIKAYVDQISTSAISEGDSNVTVTDSGTGAVTIDVDGSTIITMNATTALDISAATDAVRLPNGTTEQRPLGSLGMIRYNSSTDNIEGYTSAGGWAQLGATSTTTENTDDTSTTTATAISTTQVVIDQFVTSSFDSAWYLAVTRDEINNEVSTAKYSLVHDDTTAYVATSHITESDPTNAYLTAQADITGGNVRLLGTGGSVVNSISTYRIALGDNTTAGTTGNVTNTINLDVDSAAEKIDGWTLASYRGAKYYISVNNTTTGEVSNTEALVVHNGSTAYITQYGNVNTGSNDLIILTAEVDSTEVIIKASANQPNCRVTVYRILLADNEGGSTGDNVNVVAATTVDSSSSVVDTFNTQTYTGAFYVVTGYNSTEGVASISEVMLVANDDAYLSAGPILSTKGTDQLTFTGTLSGTTVSLNASSTSGSSTIVNAYRVHMLRGSAGASTADTVLVSTEQTITGAKTFTSPIALTVGSDPNGVADKAHIYAKDEASSAEVYVRDEAGNVTKISPHNQAGEWEYYSRNTRTGKTVRINMEEMIRDIEKLTGKTYIKND